MDKSTKTCIRCGKTKPLDEFNRARKAKDGRRSECRKCDREARQAYYVANRTERKAAARAYRAANKEKARASDLRRGYGLTLEDYDEMLGAQGNACAICGMTPEENGKRLSVDHDHETGAVRGLLCNRCNTGLGWFRDNLALLRSAGNYMRAAQLFAANNDEA